MRRAKAQGGTGKESGRRPLASLILYLFPTSWTSLRRDCMSWTTVRRGSEAREGPQRGTEPYCYSVYMLLSLLLSPSSFFLILLHFPLLIPPPSFLRPPSSSSFLFLPPSSFSQVVDEFVIMEGTHSHRMWRKPLFFERNKQRFAPFLHKIIHVVVDDADYRR